MVRFQHTPQLESLLAQSRVQIVRKPFYFFDDAEFGETVRELLDHHNTRERHEKGDAAAEVDHDQISALAAYRLLSHPDSWHKVPDAKDRTHELLEHVRLALGAACILALIGILLFICLIVMGEVAHAQNVTIQGIKKGTTGGAQATVTCTDANHCAIDANITGGGGTGGGPADVGLSTAASESDATRQKVTSAIRLWDQSAGAGSQLTGWRGDATNGAWVNCKSGCSGSSFADNSAFIFGTTTVGMISAVVDDVATNTVAENSAGAVRMNTNRILYVDLSKTAANTNKLLVTADAITFASPQPVTESGTWTNRIVGNTGAILDAAGQNAASPANWLATGCQFNTTPTTITNGNSSPVQCDNAAKLLVNVGTPAVTQSGTWTVQPGNTANSTPWLTTDSATSATGAAVPAKAGYIGGAASGSTGGNLTGIPVSDSYKNINVSTATTTLLVTGVSGRQVRIGALHLVVAGADNVAFIEGTGATCGTGTAGMAGGTTAASGYNFQANGGISVGSGLGTVMQTVTTGDSVCIVTSAAVQASGGIQYAIY